MWRFLVIGCVVVGGFSGCVDGGGGGPRGGAGGSGGTGGAGGAGGTGGSGGSGPTTAPGRYPTNGAGVPAAALSSMTCQPTAPDCAALWNDQSGAASCAPLSQVETFAAGRLTGLWQTAPTTLCAYTQGTASACGMLGPQNAFYCPGDNGIFWDYDFLSEQSTEHGDFAPVVIMAHEWGHRNQEALGLFGGTRVQVMNELHADCQAGIFAAVEEASGNLQMGDVEAAWSSLCAYGGTASWFDPAGHGSCQERVDAFHWGYVSARSNLAELCGGCAFEAMATLCAN